MILIQKSRIGRRVFEVRNGHIEIAGGTGARATQVEFPLSDIEPQPEELCVSRSATLIFLLGLTVLTIIATVTLLRQTTLPKQMAIWSGMVVPILLWQASKAIMPIELRRFRSRSGHFLFDIVRERNQASEVDDFIAALGDKIRDEKAEEPAA